MVRAVSSNEMDYFRRILSSSPNSMNKEELNALVKDMSSTADRTNLMTKFHSNDLDLVSQILVDKEKDLEMAAKIGQSLLQRNKNLMEKIEKMEDFLLATKDNEEQLKFDLKQKNQLMKMYYEGDEEQSTSSGGSRDNTCEDEEMINLTRRCRNLEKENHDLFSEALNLRDMTNDIEEKEEDLVLDCIEQLSEAKSQITNLTDEIAQKFEDNVQQQEEITQLINMVVELQKKQKQLSIENEELQSQLLNSNANQNNLQAQLLEMQEKFRETHEMLQENQEEMKSLKSRLDYSNNPSEWLNDTTNSISLQDSLANEIEESVRRDLNYTEDKRRQTKKVFENVRFLNTKTHDGFSRSTSGRTSPVSTWSLASDERSETNSTIGSLDFDNNRPRKPAKKLQIVKPMEGSDTLNKWHHLASQNVRGGLNLSEGEKSPPPKIEMQLEDEHTTIVGEEKTVTNAKPVEESPTQNEQFPVKNPPKQSTPQAKSLLSTLNTPTKRTIITRSSSALNSLRQGRKMLREKETAGKSKSEVIDMIANAMNKVNVEAQTGQRILSSLQSKSNGRERALSVSQSPDYKEYKDMPNVSRVLEKAAHAKESESTGSEGTLSPHRTPTEERNTSSILPDDALNRISGPLGLLSRADPVDSNEKIMDRLYRFSGHDTNAPQPIRPLKKPPLISDDKSNELDFDSGISTTSSSHGSSMKRNKSSGSLVDMVMSNKLQTAVRRPFGLASLVNTSSGNILNNDVIPISALKDSTSKSVEEVNTAVSKLKETSKSVETGLNDVKKTETAPSGYGGFFSFLGKLT